MLAPEPLCWELHLSIHPSIQQVFPERPLCSVTPVPVKSRVESGEKSGEGGCCRMRAGIGAQGCLWLQSAPGAAQAGRFEHPAWGVRVRDPILEE